MIKRKCVFLQTNLDNSMLMDTIYEKLIEQLNTMTPEQLDAEWEELKEYNFGPTMEQYDQMVVEYQTMLAQYPLEDYSIDVPKVDNDFDNLYFLAA